MNRLHSVDWKTLLFALFTLSFATYALVYAVAGRV